MVRTLVASANILARHGQQQTCEDVLATTRDTYKLYVADLKSGKAPTADVPGWQAQQITAAQPVTDKNASLRSDQLLGIAVLSPQNAALGSVDDIVMSPQPEGLPIWWSRGVGSSGSMRNTSRFHGLILR